MAKSRVHYLCQECGSQQVRWAGRCPDCGQWNTLVEEIEQPAAPRGAVRGDPPKPITAITSTTGKRISSGIGEFDRLLGGGLVEGSAVLVGGDPGIGKSTLLLQVCAGLSARGIRSLYVTAEESALQLKLRADRLGLGESELFVLAETDVDVARQRIQELSPGVVVIDSIQMVYKSDLPSAPGSVAQVRQCATDLVQLAKRSGAPVFLIGHVTKSGAIAGPRVLEHIVDTVLYFEGDRYHAFRLLRATKNRFGPTNEIGVFEMAERGLIEVDNPSRIFLEEAQANAPGSAVVCCLEGTRPLLVEVQALCARCNYGTPARRTTGVDYNRLAMLVAVLEKRGGLSLYDQDVFVNVAGGVRLVEPAADLAVALAVAGSFLEKRLPERSAVIGEVGLGGEIRSVRQVDLRVAEALKLGYQSLVLPARSRLDGPQAAKATLHRVATIADAIAVLE